MEIKLRALIESQNAIDALNQTEGLSSVTAYRISKNVKNIAAELEDFEKQRIKFCEKYAKKDDKGNPLIEGNAYVFEEENLDTLNGDIESIKDEEVDIKIRKIKLEDIDKAGLTPAMISKIVFMLDVDDEE